MGRTYLGGQFEYDKAKKITYSPCGARRINSYRFLLERKKKKTQRKEDDWMGEIDGGKKWEKQAVTRHRVLFQQWRPAEECMKGKFA